MTRFFTKRNTPKTLAEAGFPTHEQFSAREEVREARSARQRKDMEIKSLWRGVYAAVLGRVDGDASKAQDSAHHAVSVYLKTF